MYTAVYVCICIYEGSDAVTVFPIPLVLELDIKEQLICTLVQKKRRGEQKQWLSAKQSAGSM